MKTLSRRQLIRGAVQAAGVLTLGGALAPLFAAPEERRFKIGACDWSIGKLGDATGMELAKRLGLDGLQVSLGTLGDNMKLRQREVQQSYFEACKTTGMQIGSLAIGEMNNIPYKSDARAEQWVIDSIDACKAVGCQVVLLAFFGNGDLKGDKAGIDETVKRLKKAAPKAERAGVSLGIESWLSAEEHMDIIERVGSPAVRVYYDVANSLKMGYDIYKEIRWLGRKHICEFHMKENGFLLGKGEVDFHKVRAAIEDIGYEGWMHIEGAVPSGEQMFESYLKNCAYLRGVFAV